MGAHRGDTEKALESISEGLDLNFMGIYPQIP